MPPGICPRGKLGISGTHLKQKNQKFKAARLFGTKNLSKSLRFANSPWQAVDMVGFWLAQTAQPA